MADILIRGMEMPNVGEKIEFTQNIAGRIYAKFNPSRGYMCEVIELPEHGDLIDAESLADDLLYDAELADRALNDMSLVGSERDYMQSEKDIKQNCAYYVSHTPVVIPSNKEDKNAN